MIRNRHDSVWDAIDETREQAQHMNLRSTLTMALQEHIARAKNNRAQAARLFGVTRRASRCSRSQPPRPSACAAARGRQGSS